MGTSGAYTGAGGKAGKEVGDGLSDWLDSLAGAPDGGDGAQSAGAGEEGDQDIKPLPPKAVSGLMKLLQPRSSGGGTGGGSGSGESGIARGGSSTRAGGGRTRSGSGRSSRRLASVAGRTAAGAYAFVRGDEEGLRSLGLDYDELRALGDPFEVTRRLVDAVCGLQADGRLEEAEERYVAASVADWILEQSKHGELPDVEDTARYAIAMIVFEIFSSELGEKLRNHSDQVANIAGEELRDACLVLARQTELNLSGPTEDQLTKAIEDGLEKLRMIYGDDS